MLMEVSLYSSNSNYSNIHPIEKLLLVLISLISCSYTKNSYILVVNILFFIFLNLRARNPLKIVWQFFLASLLFGDITAVALFLQGYDLKYVVIILLRGINGAFTIAFFALTTPINHIVYVMSKWEYTRDIGDIIKTMERFIILLEGDFFISFNAIKSRGGFDGFINFIKDFGHCCGIVFRNMMIRWQDINLSLKNRCYQGRHNYNYEFRFKKLRLVFICLYIIIMIYINNIIKRYDVLL